jgi:hypothetical protein
MVHASVDRFFHNSVVAERKGMLCEQSFVPAPYKAEHKNPKLDGDQDRHKNNRE